MNAEHHQAGEVDTGCQQGEILVDPDAAAHEEAWMNRLLVVGTAPPARRQPTPARSALVGHTPVAPAAVRPLLAPCHLEWADVGFAADLTALRPTWRL
jgi:hypothetical protein